MNAAVEVIDAEAVPVVGTTLATASDNPYLAMAGRAMELGRVDQLDKLLDLQIKWDAERSRKAFVAAMADFKAEAGSVTISKAKHVSFQTSKGRTEYDHAELHDITRALVPIMAKHGLSHRWTVEQKGGIRVECIISHRDGHSECVEMSAPADDSGGKNNIQAIASTKTYLERYTLLAATGMATGGELDNDGRSYGQQDDGLDDKAREWITKADKIKAREDYVAQKAALLAAYENDAKNLPTQVREAFNRANAETLPKD